jgi:16S rRNA U516 pseudouridylate synthase RsuA-like enzyme
MSKLGLASRAEARRLIVDGRVRVDGRVVRHPTTAVALERARISIDGAAPASASTGHRVLLFHKPRGTVTTMRDPEGRRTVFDVLGDAGRGLVAVGRLDLASTGLLIFTNDTQLANRLTDPAERVPRRYVVTVGVGSHAKQPVNSKKEWPRRSRARAAAPNTSQRRTSRSARPRIAKRTSSSNSLRAGTAN